MTKFVPAGQFPGKRPKYGNRRTRVDGLDFDSGAEAARWSTLKILERTGHVRDIRRQVRFRLVVAGVLVCSYIADFVYWDERLGREVVEDVKSKATRTDVYRIKRKLMMAVHGIEVAEVIR